MMRHNPAATPWEELSHRAIMLSLYSGFALNGLEHITDIDQEITSPPPREDLRQWIDSVCVPLGYRPIAEVVASSPRERLDAAAKAIKAGTALASWISTNPGVFISH